MVGSWTRRSGKLPAAVRVRRVLRERLAASESQLNDEPGAEHRLLRPKTGLDLQEERLRV